MALRSALSLSSLLLAAAPGIVLAQPHQGPPGGGPGGMMGRGMGPGMGLGMGPFAGLKVTPQQRQKIAEARLAMLRKVAPARAEVAVKRAELHLLWMAEAPSRQAILAKAGEIDAAQAKMREAQVDFRLALLATLTPEQRQLLREHGPGGGMGPGRRMMRIEKLRIGGEGPFGAGEMFDDELLAFAGDLDDDDDDDGEAQDR